MSNYVETPLIPPPGMAKGLNLRVAAFGSIAAPAVEKLPDVDWDTLEDAIDPVLSIRPYVRKVLSQGSVGSCATEMIAQMVMTTRVKRGQKHVLLNPWSVYCHTSGGVDRGSNIDTNLEFVMGTEEGTPRGILPEAVWPRSKGWRAKPPIELYDRFGCHFTIDEALDIGSTKETVQALVDEFGVGFGWQGHSCLLTEAKDLEWAEYVNSWDQTWGDDGFGMIRFRSINYGYGAIAGRTVRICPADVLEEIDDLARIAGLPD